MDPSPERQREIADFFAAREHDVRESVAHRVRHLPAAAIEDACQTACEKLSRRPDVDLRSTGRAWLVTVAVHEAFEYYRRERVEMPAGSFRTPYADSAAPDEMREPRADNRDVADQVADRMLHTRRLNDLRTIKPLHEVRRNPPLGEDLASAPGSRHRLSAVAEDEPHVRRRPRQLSHAVGELAQLVVGIVPFEPRARGPAP